MQIDLPQDIVERVQLRAAAGRGSTEAEVIRRALDSLDWLDQERQAIQERIDGWRAGNFQDLKSRGIDEHQAADLRQRLKPFADDWDRPEMDVYDAV